MILWKPPRWRKALIFWGGYQLWILQRKLSLGSLCVPFQLGVCPSRSIRWSWEVTKPIMLIPGHRLTDTFTLGYWQGRLVIVQLHLQQAQFGAFPSKGYDSALPLGVCWICVLFGHVVVGQNLGKLGPSGWTPRDGLEGLLATSQLLKTKENKKKTLKWYP